MPRVSDDDGVTRLRYRADEDDRLVAPGALLFAVSAGLCAYFTLSAWLSSPDAAGFAATVGWAVGTGLLVLFTGTRVYVRWRQRRTRRTVGTSTPRVVPRSTGGRT